MEETFKIRNYTTDIPVAKTVYEIEQLLVEAGAEAIAKQYRGDGRIDALVFKYQGMSYRMPSMPEKCAEIIKKYRPYSNKTPLWNEQQAERVTWRVIKDWLDSQLSLIRIGQAEVEQVMLPYAWNGKESLYERIKGNGGLTALMGGKEW